jgi:hypothetical protein
MPLLSQECLIRRCLLSSAQEHARQAFGIPMHRIGVPRGAAHGRGCRGRGRPLPPAAQAN